MLDLCFPLFFIFSVYFVSSTDSELLYLHLYGMTVPSKIWKRNDKINAYIWKYSELIQKPQNQTLRFDSWYKIDYRTKINNIRALPPFLDIQDTKKQRQHLSVYT